MVQYLGFLLTGLMLGFQHSLEPDHVAAVSTMVGRDKSLKRSALTGVIWGVGHTTTILAIGVVVLLLKISIPAIVSRFFEFCVGMVLIYLGAVLLRKVIRDKVHLHRHQHDGVEHLHFHSHQASGGHDHLHKPFLVGMVHGLAGSAGVMLLVMASMNSVGEGLLFALTFGVGSMVGMAITGTVIGLPLMFTAGQSNLNRGIMIVIACISVILGLSVMQRNWVF